MALAEAANGRLARQVADKQVTRGAAAAECANVGTYTAVTTLLVGVHSHSMSDAPIASRRT